MAGGLLSPETGGGPGAALKWSRLISGFKYLWSYSKSSRHEGRRPGTSETSVGICWGIPHHLCSPPSPLRRGGVPPSSLFLSLTPSAKDCFLQPKANLILSPVPLAVGHRRCLPRRTCEAHLGTRAQSRLCTPPHDIMFTARGGPRTPPPNGIAPRPSIVCPSRGRTERCAGRWREQDWPQSQACLERSG